MEKITPLIHELYSGFKLSQVITQTDIIGFRSDKCLKVRQKLGTRENLKI